MNNKQNEVVTQKYINFMIAKAPVRRVNGVLSVSQIAITKGMNLDQEAINIEGCFGYFINQREEFNNNGKLLKSDFEKKSSATYIVDSEDDIVTARSIKINSYSPCGPSVKKRRNLKQGDRVIDRTGKELLVIS